MIIQLTSAEVSAVLDVNGLPTVGGYTVTSSTMVNYDLLFN